MSGIFRHITGICQPISHTRYMSRICLTYSFRVISILFLEYSRHIPRIFFPSHFVVCLEYTWIIPLLAAISKSSSSENQAHYNDTTMTYNDLQWKCMLFIVSAHCMLLLLLLYVIVCHYYCYCVGCYCYCMSLSLLLCRLLLLLYVIVIVIV